MIRPGRRISGLILGAALLGLVGTLPPAPAAAADREAPKPTARDKCPVCGMFVAKYPDWLAAICLRNGTHVYFDGAKDMFKYLHDPKRYDPARGPADIRDIAVMDYYGLNWIDGRKAWYVLGSDVYGPMGRELIPLAREADAREFMKDHKGTRIVRFAEATPEVIRSLD
jgi:nitrous oxide reductase accessory protein NosL